EKYKEPVPEKERDRKYREHMQRQQYEGEDGGRRYGSGVKKDKHDTRKKKDRRKRFGKRRY
ncbi:MAG TPA: hypothetical protein VI338_01015, partial [Nitrososphaera sp.]|nr:hypothetical protein [Nitrososphaera sp.]